jgi:hypothetical protein
MPLGELPACLSIFFYCTLSLEEKKRIPIGPSHNMMTAPYYIIVRYKETRLLFLPTTHLCLFIQPTLQ